MVPEGYEPVYDAVPFLNVLVGGAERRVLLCLRNIGL